MSFGILTRVKKTIGQFKRKLSPVSASAIRTGLEKCGGIKSDTLFVHSSLSACGAISGGEKTVIDALVEWVGSRNLALPVHTYCYPNSKGEREVFDPAATRSKVGAITDYFWRQPGVVRSLHPTHSLAVLGADRKELCAAHEVCETPCGPGTPYVRMLERDAAVLMFGATMNAYTLFHTAEDAARVPYLYEAEPYDLFVKQPDGSKLTVRMWRQDMNVTRRFVEMDTWLEQRGALVRVPLGRGELLFIPSSQKVHALITEQLRSNPFFLVASDLQPEIARRFKSKETAAAFSTGPWRKVVEGSPST